MKSSSRLSRLLGILLLLTLSACGVGSESNTIGSLSLAVEPQMSLKGSVTAKAIYTNPLKSNLQGLEITFTTDKPEIIASRVVKTDSSGTATCILTANSPISPVSKAPTAPTVVTITASVGDLIQKATFIVKPASLTVTPPTAASVSGGGFVGSVVRVVPSGMFAKVVDGDGVPLANIPVTVEVSTIVNGTAGDVLFWPDYPAGTSSAPPSVFTKKTDANGQVPFQMTIDVVVPSVSHVVSVVWKVSFTDPDSGATISQYATTGITATP